MGKVYINGNEYTFNEGETILDVARRNDEHIPVLCYLKDITPTGACRLCLVEVEGIDKTLAACVTYCLDGMKVTLDTDKVKKNRKMMMDFILAKHPLDCPVCDKAGECLLQDTAYEFGITSQVVDTDKPQDPVQDWERILYNSNLCVLCERCTKVCHEVTGCSALKMEDRGFFNHIVPSNGKSLDCDYCGICVDNCPVGALLDKTFRHTARVWDLQDAESTCTLCPVGCTLEYGVADGEVRRAKSTEESFICSKGRYAFPYLTNETRITTPVVKKEGAFSAISWEEAVEYMKQKVAGVGGDAAFVLGSRLTNESLYAYKKLATQMGAPFCTEADLVLGTFMQQYKAKFGSTDSFGTMEDLRDADLIFVVGADFARESVGVKWRMMNAAVRNSANLVAIGLREYEYNYYANHNIIADYGNFAKVLENIKTSDDANFAEIRGYVAKAKNVAIIVGNEYLEAEKQSEAVLAFADFVGQEKLANFLVLNDRANFMGALTLGGDAQAVLKKLESGVKLLVTAGFSGVGGGNAGKVAELAGKAGFMVSVDMFENAVSKQAHMILPAKAPMETVGTITTLDGRIAKVDKVVDAPAGAKVDAIVAADLGTALGVKMEGCVIRTWNEIISGTNGFPEIRFDEVDGGLYRERVPSFNATAFAYDNRGEKQITVSVNPRYHAGVTIAKANYTYTDEGVAKSMYLQPGTEQSGKVAKGVIFTTR